jgi:hypothetical protein
MLKAFKHLIHTRFRRLRNNLKTQYVFFHDLVFALCAMACS